MVHFIRGGETYKKGSYQPLRSKSHHGDLPMSPKEHMKKRKAVEFDVQNSATFD